MFGSQQPPGTPAASEVSDNFAALPLRPHQRVHVLDGTHERVLHRRRLGDGGQRLARRTDPDYARYGLLAEIDLNLPKNGSCSFGNSLAASWLTRLARAALP